eukprot:scaffold90929_cov30-Tisochrysis_lutea.AAC.1
MCRTAKKVQSEVHFFSPPTKPARVILTGRPATHLPSFEGLQLSLHVVLMEEAPRALPLPPQAPIPSGGPVGHPQTLPSSMN